MYWPNLEELNDDTVNAAYLRIAQMVEEKHPELNARRGVLGDLVTELHAILQGAGMEMVERLRKSMSAMELATDPENAIPGAVDALASNYRIHRHISTKARGTITVLLTRCSGINFSKNAKFRANGQLFHVSEQVSVKPPGSKKHARNDMAATRLENGKFSVQVPVIAASVHEDTMLKRFDTVTPAIRPVGFDSAYATNDFVGGSVPQSNEDLIRQMQGGAAVPGFSGPVNVKALVQAGATDFSDVVVLGACDPEMTRDRRDGTISGGGKIDIYLRGRNYPESRCLAKTATLVEKTEEGGVWQVEIGRDEASGFYEVRDIRPTGSDPGTPGCVVTEDTRTLDTEGEDPLLVPDMMPVDSVHSRYEKRTVTFSEKCEPFGLIASETTRAFDVTVLVVPGIDEVQDRLNSPEVRQPGLDVLIRAVTPVWLIVEVFCQSPVDEEACRQAAANYVNSLRIGEQPRAFRVANAMPDPEAVSDVVITGGSVVDRSMAAFVNPENVRIR